jgi:hypothetical protein
VPRTVTIPRDGTVLVGLTNPPTIPVGCQVVELAYDDGSTYVSNPIAGGLAGLLVYTGSGGASLTVAWLVDAGGTNSLSDFLEDNAGDTVYVKAQPTPDSPVAYTYTCQAAPGTDLLGRAGVPIATTVRLPVSARTKTVL